MRASLDRQMAGSVVAFDAEETCSPESRAAIAIATEILRDLVKADLENIASGIEPAHLDAYLPPAWQIGLDKDFIVGMANAMSFVASGLRDVGWEGPANTAEELCLTAIFNHAISVVPDIAFVKDMDGLEDAILYLQEVGFQDVANDSLFAPEIDASAARRDAFKRFANR